MKLRTLDLFAGIGGFSLGLERTGGFETVAFCEIEPYPQKVLANHWPGVPIYDDVRELTADRLLSDGIGIDVITGGFPCQDISHAGNQAGISEGTRSGLWSECARLLGELRPQYAIFENVTALLSGDNGRWFEQVLWDISQVGYDAEWHCIPASELGAHHHRDRVWIIAYPSEDRHHQLPLEAKLSEWHELMRAGAEGGVDNVADTISKGSQGFTGYGENGSKPRWQHKGQDRSACPESLLANSSAWASEPDVGRVANGVPARSHRLKSLGNAVVPQIPELIGRAILEAANDDD